MVEESYSFACLPSYRHPIQA